MATENCRNIGCGCGWCLMLCGLILYYAWPVSGPSQFVVEDKKAGSFQVDILGNFFGVFYEETHKPKHVTITDAKGLAVRCQEDTEDTKSNTTQYEGKTLKSFCKFESNVPETHVLIRKELGVLIY